MTMNPNAVCSNILFYPHHIFPSKIFLVEIQIFLEQSNGVAHIPVW